MYDPIAGRFLEEDPEDFAAGDPNLFRYVKNEPTNATDPSGREESHYLGMTTLSSLALGLSGALNPAYGLLASRTKVQEVTLDPFGSTAVQKSNGSPAG